VSPETSRFLGMARKTLDATDHRRRCPKDKPGTRRLYQLMQQHGMSEYALAQASGVDYKTIRSVLDEERRPSVRVQRDLAVALRVEPWAIWDALARPRRQERVATLP
jgi:lambda repressor-like predicted transcriptional regulator